LRAGCAILSASSRLTWFSKNWYNRTNFCNNGSAKSKTTRLVSW